MTNWIFIPYMLVMTLMGAVGGFCLKRAADVSDSLVHFVFNRWIWAGGFAYLACVAMNVYVLQVRDYTIVLPMTALTYGWTLCLAKWWLKERIRPLKWLGVGLICLGVSVIIVYKGVLS